MRVALESSLRLDHQPLVPRGRGRAVSYDRVTEILLWFANASFGSLPSRVGRAHDRVADLPEGRMSRIRILIGGMPRMLRDIVGDAIARQPDMELVASGEPTELATTIARQQPDAVILAEEGPGLNWRAWRWRSASAGCASWW